MTSFFTRQYGTSGS